MQHVLYKFLIITSAAITLKHQSIKTNILYPARGREKKEPYKTHPIQKIYNINKQSQMKAFITTLITFFFRTVKQGIKELKKEEKNQTKLIIHNQYNINN